MTTKVSVVIPSIKDDIRTIDSVPDDIPVSVEREGTLNEARNRGVRNADSDIVAILDDDIAFSADLFYALLDHLKSDMLLGVADWEFGLVAGRVMLFYKNLWREVGGFDERLRSHNGDTDFSLRVHGSGYNVEPIPRSLFYHEEHERSITTWDRAWRLAYLCGKHPRYALYLLSSTVAYNFGHQSGIDRDLYIPPSLTGSRSNSGGEQ